MSSTLHFALVREPHLLDIVDEEWARDSLSDDGEQARLMDATP